MGWSRFQHRFIRLQPERQGATDQFGVVVAGVSRPGFGEVFATTFVAIEQPEAAHAPRTDRQPEDAGIQGAFDPSVKHRRHPPCHVR